MKKIVSLLMTVAMMISTASVAFAADANFILDASATSVEPGDVVTFTVKLDTNPGMAYFKNIIEFDETAFERVSYLYEVIEDEEVVEEIEYDVYSTWGSITCNDAQDNKTIMVWTNSSDKKGKSMLKINYQVKDDATNGAYDFTILAEQILNAAGKEVSVEAATTAITVTGGKEPAGSNTKATVEVVGNDSNKAQKAEGEPYTQGFKFEVIGNNETVTAVPFTLKADGKEKAYAGFTGLEITGATPVYFGLNVKEVPYNKTVEATPSVVVAE